MQNLVILAGNVGATPETRTTQGGTRITHFSLATSRPKRDSNGKILATTTIAASRIPNGTGSPASTASARRSSNMSTRA
jgi:hypothetical protein